MFSRDINLIICYLFCFLCPRIERTGAHSFWPILLSVCPFVCLQKLLHWPYLLLVRLRAFIFRMSIPCDKTFLLVPSSRSSVKDTVFKRMAIAEALVFHKHSLYMYAM